MLYYPSVNVPQRVLRQAALYWDHVSTVVPENTERHFDPAMRMVRDAGLYQPIQLRALRHIQEEMLHELRGVSGQLRNLRQSLPEDGPEACRLYVEKFSSDVMGQLVQRGLVVRENTSVDPRTGIIISGSVLVPAQTELCMLSIVARKIAAQRNGQEGCTATNSLIPYTDHTLAHQLSCTIRRYEARESPCWEIEAGALFPTPRDDVPLSEIIAFRERHEDERRRLMWAIHLLAHELQRNYDHPQDVFRVIRRELEEALDDLMAAGRAERISWIKRSVSLAIALGAGFTGSQILPQGGWLLGVVGGYALNVATTGIQPRGDNGGDDFSYLHRAHSLTQ
ncbi:DUF6236 family protein [Streptomyces sp. Inha503]|uniref:DUF6236 family protein n=1 Tax=Streptomyces sp. Inha503 TaxID=3383314 RepID=UPI0039A09028